jgi:hypothetical protein
MPRGFIRPLTRATALLLVLSAAGCGGDTGPAKPKAVEDPNAPKLQPINPKGNGEKGGDKKTGMQ